MPSDLASAYLSLIQTYFPDSEWANARCILNNETPAECVSAPESCVTELPEQISCYTGQPFQDAKAYGLFGIVDVCWSPLVPGTNTPFTADEWANALDPNVNIWMASVIWSISGWRAWSSCTVCNNCYVAGTIIPHPRNPVVPSSQSSSALPGVVASAAGIALGILAAMGG